MNHVSQLFRSPASLAGTRAVIVEFNLYNTQTRMATTVRFYIEIFPSAYILPWSRVFSFQVVLYEAYLDQVSH